MWAHEMVFTADLGVRYSARLLCLTALSTVHCAVIVIHDHRDKPRIARRLLLTDFQDISASNCAI
jgi:hypothetical protein